MPYTLWSRGRLLGESDLGFVQTFDNLRAGWFHPSPAGETLIPVLTGGGPALRALGKILRDPIRQLSRGEPRHDDHPYPRDIRATTEYADLLSSIDEVESLRLELRDPDGLVVPTEHIGIDDMQNKRSVSRRDRGAVSRMEKGERWKSASPQSDRYQIHVHLDGFEAEMIRETPRR